MRHGVTPARNPKTERKRRVADTRARLLREHPSMKLGRSLESMCQVAESTEPLGTIALTKVDQSLLEGEKQDSVECSREE